MGPTGSNFDPAAFLDATLTESNSLVTVPIPVGEHLAVIEKVSTRAWQGKQDPSKSGIALDVQYIIDSPAVKEVLGRDKVTVTQGLMLDLTESGSLDMGKGKNVQLGRLRDACGLNVAGAPFNFRMLEGKPVKVVIGHRPSDRPSDPPGTVFSDVNGVVKAY